MAGKSWDCVQRLPPRRCSSIQLDCLPSLADGLFGQCQVGSVQDRPYFQVTSSVLQRLQDVLRHLMAQGERGSAVGRGCQAAFLSGTAAAWGPAAPGARLG